MSNSTSIVDVIQHYQRSIDVSQDNEPRLLHCINKLYKLPIKVEHLEKTGVGKTVNSLRRFNGEIGVAAKTLVTKWKAMVSAEEESIKTVALNKYTEVTEGNGGPNGPAGQAQMHVANYNRSEAHESWDDCKQNKEQDIQKFNNDHNNYKSNDNNNGSRRKAPVEKSTYQEEKKDSGKYSKSTDVRQSKDVKKMEHQQRESKHQSNSKHNSCSSSSHKDRERRHVENMDKDEKKHHRHRHSERLSTEMADSLKKENVTRHHETNYNKLESKQIHKRHRKTDHDNETNEHDFKSPPNKKTKTSSSDGKYNKLKKDEIDDDKEEDDGFDSSMGANFADVLGMLNMPKRKHKKNSKSSPGANCSVDAVNMETTATSSTTTTKRSTSSQSILCNNSNPGIRSHKNTHTSSTSNLLPSSSKPLTTKPDMLSPTVKLEPLDPNIALELPTISTNYKPMPLNLTVMDCVFNTHTSNSTRPARTLSDAEALNHGISSKTIRTKVYSGVRTGQIFQVPSLFDLCIRVLQKNIDALEYTGGVPFDVLQPVLKKATPQQLFTFEDYNPYLMEDTDTLWQIHVSRNYRTQKRLENETWREMFLRCQEEEERKLNYLADSIKQSQKIAAAPVRKTQLAFLDTMVKPPRNVQRKQEQYGTKAKLVATPAARVASLSAIAPNAAKLGDVRLKVNTATRDKAQISNTTSSSIVAGISRPKKAPLMQKTLQFIRGRLKR